MRKCTLSVWNFVSTCLKVWCFKYLKVWPDTIEHCFYSNMVHLWWGKSMLKSGSWMCHGDLNLKSCWCTCLYNKWRFCLSGAFKLRKYFHDKGYRVKKWEWLWLEEYFASPKVVVSRHLLWYCHTLFEIIRTWAIKRYRQ